VPIFFAIYNYFLKPVAKIAKKARVSKINYFLWLVFCIIQRLPHLAVLIPAVSVVPLYYNFQTKNLVP